VVGFIPPEGEPSVQSEFKLIVNADHPNLTAEFRLVDGHGSQLAFRQTDFRTFSVSRRQALFDLRSYLHYYVEEGKEAASVAEIGVCIAEDVLGEEVFLKLWESTGQRTLRIQLPCATDEGNHLAAALGRVPWETARPTVDRPTLAERNLLIRIVHDMPAPATQPLVLNEEECLRVLFVFAEARGSRPLAVRRERLELLRLFEKEIYPQRRIIAHFLTHGVTRERLRAQIQENGGYHLVHWSGHGHLNRLELAKPGGAQDSLSGNDLLALFIHAGGFIPRLCFLSACHSGDILRVKDWNDFFAVAQGKEPGIKGTEASEPKDIALDAQPGYTGTAHALLQGGVPCVVAMRYAVGDDYARELGIEFYRALLAHQQPKIVSAALTMARQALLNPKIHNPTFYAACDHATPVLFGDDDHGLRVHSGRSPALDTHNPRLHRIVELDTASHTNFVGRTWELAGLGADFIGSSRGAEVKPVAVITGLGGMGKTALAAEALALWESCFEWVLIYQAKPNALAFEATLRDIHMKLYAELGHYHEHVKARPADAIYRTGETGFTGQDRLERLTRNLIRALREESILLVIDNFEANLKSRPEANCTPAFEPLWSCKDPTWDRCLALFVAELIESPSRVLVTCRRPLAALNGTASHRVMLGPLSAGEAALYLREHKGLSKMVFSGDTAEQALAERLLNASRFHPLLMDRLARLAAGGPQLRPQLMLAIETLEHGHNYALLPDLFTTSPGDAKELAYLEEALATSLDQLIQNVGPDARRLLWMIGIAHEPVTLVLLKAAWSGDTLEQESLRELKRLLDVLPELPREQQEKLGAMPPEMRARIESMPPDAPTRQDPAPLLRHMVAVGLAIEQRAGSHDNNPELTCHDLVRERILTWMNDHPQDRADLTGDGVRLAYAERLEFDFNIRLHRNMSAAVQSGCRALVYYVEAGAYDRLCGLANRVVTSAGETRLVQELIPYLEAAANSAPRGRPRWCSFGALADALKQLGYADASLPFYEQAATQARIAAEDADQNDLHAWSDLAVITANWANALVMKGSLNEARERRIESAEYERRAGSPAVYVIGHELEALRIDMLQGQVAETLPQVEARLAQLEGWWQQHCSGQKLPAAGEPEFLARVLLTALNIAERAYSALEDWDTALRHIDARLGIERRLGRPAEDTAVSRLNRAIILTGLGRRGEAKAELEECLAVFRNHPANKLKVLGSLAILFSKEGDLPQAISLQRRALALSEQLPDPDDRATSHNNLAEYLKLIGSPSDLAEASFHQMAALVYRLVSGLGQHLQDSRYNYATDLSNGEAAPMELAVPRLADLLADPVFHPLKEWLHQSETDLAEVQAAVDQFLNEARGQARR
jgi:tetratricopeptide (TPR) repeat protein